MYHTIFLWRVMTGLFSTIFILSLVLGCLYGWINHYAGFQLLVPVIVGGFFGSCVIAIIFIYLYFTHTEMQQGKVKKAEGIDDPTQKKETE